MQLMFFFGNGVIINKLNSKSLEIVQNNTFQWIFSASSKGNKFKQWIFKAGTTWSCFENWNETIFSMDSRDWRMLGRNNYKSIFMKNIFKDLCKGLQMSFKFWYRGEVKNGSCIMILRSIVLVNKYNILQLSNLHLNSGESNRAIVK